MNVSEVLRNRSFVGYLVGVVLSQIGTRGAMAASLYQVYELTGSIAATGLVARRVASRSSLSARSVAPWRTGWTGDGSSRFPSQRGASSLPPWPC